MPELPEVETTKRGIEPFLLQQVITQVIVRDGRLRWPAQVPQSLVGQPISHVGRRAKYILLTTPIGMLIIHLGMSGSLRLVDPETPLKTHDHIDLLLESGRCLRYNDPRRFRQLSLSFRRSLRPIGCLQISGPEPLGNEFSGEHLFQQSRKRRIAVKNHIMDSKGSCWRGQHLCGRSVIYGWHSTDGSSGQSDPSRL
jgi:formamidopyrimidine-DNA glycosylase